MLTPKLSCSWVFLKSWLRTTWGTASRLSSTTNRVPLRSLSSRRSATPLIFLSRTSSAIFSMIRSRDTWYGTSVTTMAVRPLRTSSTSVTARIFTEPRPVSSASRPPGPDDECACWEIRALDELKEVLGGRIRVLDQVDGGVDDLRQVVWRDVGGHPHGDPGRAVDEQVGEPRRQHRRFLALPRVVVFEVDRLLVDAVEHVHGELLEPRLGVPHRRRRIVDRAEVPLRLDERVPGGELLAEPHHGVIDGLPGMRVEPPHHVSDHPGALAEGGVRPASRVVHRVEDPPMHRLEPVAHVRQGARHDHRHGVLEEGGLDLLLDVDQLDAGIPVVGHEAPPRRGLAIGNWQLARNAKGERRTP